MPHDQPAPPRTSPRWRRHHWRAVLAILLLALSIGWWSRPPEIGTAHDDAIYVALSYSLEQGRYHDEFLLGAPPHGKYPPGMALWIAAIRQVAGPDLDAVRLGNLLLLALTATLIGSAVCRLDGAWLGVGAVAVTAFNPTLLQLTGEMYSEIPYIALATFAIWATLIADQDPRRRWPLLASVIALAAFLTRLLGVALLPAILVWALLRRRWATAAGLGLGSAVTAGAWLAWSRYAAGSSLSSSYAGELRNMGGPGDNIVATMLNRVVDHFVEYAGHMDFELLALPMLQNSPVDNLLWLLLLAPPAIVGIWLLMRHWPAAAISAGLTFGILLMWVGTTERLVSPLLPTGIAALLLGGAHLGRRLPRAPSLAVGLLTVALAGLALTENISQYRWRSCDRRDPYADAGCYDAERRSYVMASRFVRDSLPVSAVVAASRPATVNYFSGRLTVSLASLIERERAKGSLEWGALGVDFLILSRLGPMERGRGFAMVDRHCRELSVRTVIPPSSTLVLAPRDSLSGTTDACSALAQYAADLRDRTP
jgi:4-amino-4-deoxy-L-arabinose transferase-like glycosyltransferase